MRTLLFPHSFEYNITMNKTTIGIAVVVLIIIAAALGLGAFKFNVAVNDSSIGIEIGASGPKDAIYIINDQAVTLKNGVAETEAAPGSASKITTKYFGNEVKHDLDGDGREDVAFLLTQEMGGSGTFFYVVAALNKVDGWVGSHATLLGDRIAPQTTNMGKGNILIVNYVERNPGESFAVRPSMGKSLYLLLDPQTMRFGEVVQNFEGEADPARMTLGMKTWNWISTTYNNDTQVKPRTVSKFTITFKNNGTFAATTDCNSVGGDYTTSGNKLTFGKMMSTMMYCDGSQESDFVKMLSEIQSFLFTSKGELVLNFKLDSGSMTLR